MHSTHAPSPKPRGSVRRYSAWLTVLLMATGWQVVAPSHAAPPHGVGATVTQIADVGSDDFVIGSTVGPDGALYVTDGVAGSVLRVDRHTGQVTTFASGLPPKAFANDAGGPIDVAFVGRKPYVLVSLVSGSFFGQQFGDPEAKNGLYRIRRDGSPVLVADLGQWSADHPPTTPYFVDTGLQFALERYRGGFLVTDGHHNRVLWVSRHGAVREVQALDNVVPTGLEVARGRVWFTELGPVPHVPEDGRIMLMRPAREPREVARGAAMLVDVEQGPHGRLYGVAQGEWNGTGEGFPALPDTGRLVVADGHGGLAAIVDGDGEEIVLDRPISIEFVGDTGYVLTLTGAVLRVDGL